jgi:hypothetical protein
VRDLAQVRARGRRHVLEEVEPSEVRVQERRRPLADGDRDEVGPGDGAAGQRDQLAPIRGVEPRARGQQEQRDLRAAAGEGDVYDVALARCDFPIVIFWLDEHVPVVARQHVVVSAPKMLLGSSVGFS